MHKRLPACWMIPVTLALTLTHVLPASAAPRPPATSAPSGPALHDVALSELVSGGQLTASRSDASLLLTRQVVTERFSVAGLTWDADAVGTDLDIALRLREGGTWSEWVDLDIETAIPDPGTDEGRSASSIIGSEPLLTDGADGVQVRVAAPPGVNFSPTDITLSLIDGGDEEVAGMVATSSSSPSIITREQWGADESLRNGTPRVNDLVKAMFVHHTASTNSYTSSNAAAQIRSIYAYHTQSLGWADIGYNFLVDKFGRIYEGRAGSITAAVQGAHTGGFNTDTMGVSALGNFDVATAPSGMVDSLGRVAGWKLGQYSQPVDANVTLTSAGGGTSRYPAGQQVSVRAISGHRDVGYTACPGQYLYDELSRIGSVAAATAAVTEPIQIGGSGATPLTADVDGDGRVDLGWFRKGSWAFETAAGKVVQFRFGREGDVPVVGDFARSGRDGIGIFRGGAWHLRGSASGGPAQLSFSYGRAGDRPVVGRWPGASRDAVGVKRGNRWYLRDAPSAGAATWSFSFGLAGDEPTTGDWNNRNRDLPGLLRDGRWHLAASTSDLRTHWSFAFGNGSDRPVAGDWDGDGSDGPGVVRGMTFLGRNSLSGGDAQFSRSFTG